MAHSCRNERAPTLRRWRGLLGLELTRPNAGLVTDARVAGGPFRRENGVWCPLTSLFYGSLEAVV
jgi:hypothetical protein